MPYEPTPEDWAEYGAWRDAVRELDDAEDAARFEALADAANLATVDVDCPF